MLCAPIFRGNEQLWIFVPKFAQKWILRSKFQKSEILDPKSASLMYYVYQFSDKTDNIEFLGQNLPKNGFWGWDFKNLSLNSESAPPIYHVCQFFNQNGQLLIFWPKFGEIAQLRGIFWFIHCWGCCKELGGGWNELDGGGWSSVGQDGRGWSWVELGAQFSNTLWKVQFVYIGSEVLIVIMWFAFLKKIADYIFL